jgi:transposase-like protein
MEKIITECPKCGALTNQIWHGCNRSGTRKRYCRECGRHYTPEPRKHAYTEEEQKQAFAMLVSGMSGRQIGLQMGMSKANVYKWAKKNRWSVDKSKD